MSTIFVTEEPQPGRWTIFVRFVKGAAFEINIGAFKRNALGCVQRVWPARRCGFCKQTVKVMIAGVIAYAAHAISLIPAAAGALAVAAEKTGLPQWMLEHVLGECVGKSMDKMAERACATIRACPA